MNILLIEDNPTIIKGLKYAFLKKYNLIVATSIKEAIKCIDKSLDLIILDITLPDGNGFDLFNNEIKKQGIPTIFLTARDEEDDIVRGLDMGAEDYITKPFSTKELMARINRILLHSKKQNIISVKDIKFDMAKMVVYKNDKIIDLTPLELKLLNLLFLDLGKVVNRNTILEYIFEYTGNYVDEHTVTVYFNRIKNKLDTNIIITVKGLGYRIDEE